MTKFPIGKTKVVLVQFPGSNCDRDCVHNVETSFATKVECVWHHETSLPKADAIILPGGFSYGDYLRSGALASHSPIMHAVKSHVAAGGAVIGICNGFQILTESHILPGVLMGNDNCRFICKDVTLDLPQSKFSGESEAIRLPIAHGEGRYVVTEDQLKSLQDNEQIAFRYQGQNPNGSVENIAGVCSRNGRVVGLMPHPERAMNEFNSSHSQDGFSVFRKFFEMVVG